ncbi:YeeE/YedE family protein [Ovoidimarina sediminis]|uniref:YeeE/YedE family protein n=1 Tax=Ovoidimarina sediminis TaxID=3079856 RepID=UPI002913FBBE|nr:YeeE/YedE family protein [Rhodophyticola sp. MJ-SS7]MDU8946562.1 YeeE/YedE family protein [Rhodophyticola sp. MJ-SS7]
MQADWLWGLGGGLMIGSAAALFLLLNGRIMGASGLVGGLIDGSGHSNVMERLAFLTGLIVVPGVMAVLAGGAETGATTAPVILTVGGLLVGLGTRLANGCTSGHGVCGISRLSRRGIVATLIYLGAGMATMWVGRHLLGFL